MAYKRPKVINYAFNDRRPGYRSRVKPKSEYSRPEAKHPHEVEPTHIRNARECPDVPATDYDERVVMGFITDWQDNDPCGPEKNLMVAMLIQAVKDLLEIKVWKSDKILAHRKSAQQWILATPPHDDHWMSFKNICDCLGLKRSTVKFFNDIALHPERYKPKFKKWARDQGFLTQE